MKSIINTHGMTLMELVVVIMVLGILSTLAIPSYVYFAASARATRLSTYATAMMTAARFSNASSLAAQLPPTDLFVYGDGLATYNWPKKSVICSLVLQQMANGPDAPIPSTVTSGGTSIICSAIGVMTDTAATGSNCKATYNESTGESVSAYVDVTSINTTNCS